MQNEYVCYENMTAAEKQAVKMLFSGQKQQRQDEQNKQTAAEKAACRVSK